MNGQYIITAVCAAAYYGTTINTEYAELAKKGFAAWCGLNGLYLLASPSGAIDLWGLKGTDAGTSCCMRVLGGWLAAFGVTIWSLIQGNDSLQSIGYGWAVLCAMCASMNFITKEVEDLKLDQNKMYAWLAFAAAAAGTLAL